MKLYTTALRGWLLATCLLTFFGNFSLAQDLAQKEGKMLKNVFIFNFGEDVATTGIDSLKADFLSLPALVDGMVSAEWGVDLKSAQKHCLILTFTTEEAQQRYGNHPIHKAIPTKYAHLLKEDFKMEIVNFWAVP
ncbi:MAG: Dabb family protein [Saprospiraceae bacterium]|nr:Dabb family protein [Saprospiraceae bacterium]